MNTVTPKQIATEIFNSFSGVYGKNVQKHLTESDNKEAVIWMFCRFFFIMHYPDFDVIRFEQQCNGID
jgi:hypothetical protein